MAKHATGPWKSQGWIPTWAYIPVHDAQHNTVAAFYPGRGDGGYKQAEANARLVAAAPDLLEAAKIVHKCGNGGARLSREASDAIRAAIAKAEGAADE